MVKSHAATWMPRTDASWRKFGKAIAESRKAGEEAES
jgi:hypothetical protein